MKDNFGERLKDLMLEENLNCVDLANKAKCNAVTICNLKNSKYQPSTKVLIKLADYFQCSVDYLYCISNDISKATYKSCPAFSSRIHFLLKHYGVSKKQLCIEAYISEQNFFLWIKDKSVPTPDSIYKIAKYFECSMDFVLGRE